MKKKRPTWGKKLTAKERFVLSRTKTAAFVEEYAKIAASLIKHPKDTLDRRTTRFHRKPNPRVLPAAMPSGKLVS